MKYWLNALIYTPKHEKPADYSILRLIMPSFVGIVICMVCLAGSTWAWFTASISTPPQTIAAANFDMDVLIADAGSRPVEETAAGRYALSADTAYTVTLTAKGSATEYGGYCKITREGADPLYTCQLIPPDGKMTFVFTPDTTADYTFTAVWGICPSDNLIKDGKEAGGMVSGSLAATENAAETIQVVRGDTLWDIAKAYDTTVAALAEYNGIENPSDLQIGQEIRIPAKKTEPSPSSSASGNSPVG